ncbi:sigma-70 family RNA polymerase sigma factor [uncultured Hyphomonas sp.]|uniref:RNA polymerase sigma factor n=1 Tax=uncultured Hyphomonas sp. TaxID=225298 RepID=UPI0030DCB100|tara:strand:- start:544 stop:1200 length:657 start_codon:yes stop_codon:yes gene_type:complete
MPDRAASLKPVTKRQLLSSRGGGRGLTLHSGHQLHDRTGADVLTELYRVQFDQLVRLSRIRIGNTIDAEDLVQDAFLAVRRAYPNKTMDELRPLLFTTLRNLTLNYLKSGNTKRRQASVELLGSDDRLGCPRTATPEIQLMDAQLLAIAEQTIAAMTARRREVLKLHRFEHLTYEEIAERLSVSRSTVKKDLADAIAEVAEALARKSGQGVDWLADRK